MRKVLIFVMALGLPSAAFAQSDPNGYAIVCNGYCTTTVQDEGGSGATTVVLPQGYVVGRVDVPTGQTVVPPTGYEYKADPSAALQIGQTTTP